MMRRRDFLFARFRTSDRASGFLTVVPAVARRPPDLPRVPSVARVRAFDCLGAAGQVCTVCVERCPEPGVVRLSGARPVIDADRCTGCGRCALACPAPNGSAIDLLPVHGRANG